MKTEAVRLSDLSPGDKVRPVKRAPGDCLADAPRVVQIDENGYLFIRCRDGKHFLDGHDYRDDGLLVGIERVVTS